MGVMHKVHLTHEQADLILDALQASAESSTDPAGYERVSEELLAQFDTQHGEARS